MKTINRRSFFKMITGFAAGIYAAFVPSKKAKANCSPIIPAYEGYISEDDELKKYIEELAEAQRKAIDQLCKDVITMNKSTLKNVKVSNEGHLVKA